MKSYRFFLSLFVVLFFSFLFATNSAFAVNKVGLTALLGGYGGGGIMKSETGSLKNRKISSLGVRYFPGWSFGGVMVGAMTQYRIITQITKASQVDNTNVGGHGYYLGAGGAFKMGPFLVQAAYDFLGSLWYFKKSASGNSQSILGPSGVTAIIGFKYTDRSWIDLYFSHHLFSKSATNGNSSDITGNRVQETVFGVGFTF